MEENDKRELIKLLNEVDPEHPYGTELFNALARVTVSVAIEAVCLRHNPETKQLEVFMMKRPMDDIAYPGQWHCPGSVLRPGEEIEDAFKRLNQQEFSGILLDKKFAATVNVPDEARGHFLSLVYLCELEENENLKGTWFMASDLPDQTVKSHRKLIIPSAICFFFD